MLFLIEANIKVKVHGISGVFSDTACYLVNSPDIVAAKRKFDAKVNEIHVAKMPESIDIQYTKIAPEI